MQIVHQMTMDMARQLPALPVPAVQGDGNTRVLEITLLENGAAWQVPQEAVVDVAFKKPDGTKGIYSKLPDGSAAAQFAGNVLSATLAPQMLTCPGAVLATVVFRTEGGKTLAAFPFTVKVEASPAAGAQVSEDYFNPTQLSDLRAEMAAGLATKAPAGYGLGTHVVSASDPDNLTGTGWFYGIPKIDGFVLGNSIIHHYENSGYSVQDARLLSATTGTGCDNTMLHREKIGGLWQPWEWVAPPMLIDTEYRTTERFNGKPVYTQAFSLGTGCSAGSVKDVENGISNLQYIISCQGFTNYPTANPTAGFIPSDLTIVSAVGGIIRISATIDTTGTQFYAILKYTKTTD